MTKKVLCRKIVEDLLNKELLNEADFSDSVSLQQEVEQLLCRHLEDFALIYKAGIIDD